MKDREAATGFYWSIEQFSGRSRFSRAPYEGTGASDSPFPVVLSHKS